MLVVLLSAVLCGVAVVFGEAEPQLPGVMVPRPVQMYGSDSGQLVHPPYNQMLYSYK